MPDFSLFIQTEERMIEMRAFDLLADGGGGS
jgi:hypothetical protein